MLLRRSKFIVLTVSMTLLAPVTLYADIYKYVDKHGRVILTDKPQSNKYKLLVKTWKGWEEKKSNVAYDKFTDNKKKYASTIDYYARLYRLPKSLLHAVITAESAYDPNAISRAGAVGLMQLMPETAKRYGVNNRRNPSDNVHGGTRYLRDLLKMFKNDVRLALAAYNAGEGAVKKHGNKIPPYKETRNYVKKVIAYYKQYRKSTT
ncbi:MAG: lytic transglycosylase domain-containing protein [Gammaproteobacteria bacterium]|mgnify:CR=1 FL=1|jgi:soluble lytic murein transglycosylase-like protein|nr:lytic transglycosylase domain-containing protein [Gammaproteobacteria bacterium]